MACAVKLSSSALSTTAGSTTRRLAAVSVSSPKGRLGNSQTRVAGRPRPWVHTAGEHLSAGFAAPQRNIATQATGLLASKAQQSNAYSTLTAVYGLLALATTFAPGQSLFAAVAAPLSPLTTCLMGCVACNVWLMVAAAKCLQEAADHNRLASDTYKRLNLGLFYQSIMLGVLQVRHRALLGNHFLGASAALLLPTAFIAARVYTASNGGVFSVPDILKGFVAGVRDCFSPKNLISTYYAISAVGSLVSGLYLLSTDTLHLLSSAHVSAFSAYLIHALGASRCIQGVVYYVQKDAADRGRLGAGTFKKLNLALAVSLAAGSWFLYQLTPLGVPVDATVQMVAVVGGLFGALVCTWQYYTAKK